MHKLRIKAALFENIMRELQRTAKRLKRTEFMFFNHLNFMHRLPFIVTEIPNKPHMYNI